MKTTSKRRPVPARPAFKSPPVFKPDWRVPVDPTQQRTNKCPHVVVAIGFVPYGYQVDMYVNGQLTSISCRDFADSYEIDDLEKRFAGAIEQTIDKLRSRL